MDDWLPTGCRETPRRAPRELEALVAVSSPSGDRHGADECASVCAALTPDDAQLERVPCSSPNHADDLIARLAGTGEGRILLLGHLDTVIAHAAHRPLAREGEKLIGSGSVDMKGGVVLSLGVLRALAARPQDYAEVALLLVCDEEWRTAPFSHTERFAGWDACLCFEGGARNADGQEGVVVRRKAAGTLKIKARGRAAHSGSAPDRGRNALLALAAAAQAVAGCHDPDGPDHLTAVPTVMHAGDAFNVVPGAGELMSDMRADDSAAFERVVAALPTEVGGATLHPEMVRVWPGMDSTEHTGTLLERASAAFGETIAPMRRGGASDASHFAAAIPVTVDGLGPRAGAAPHTHTHTYAQGLSPQPRRVHRRGVAGHPRGGCAGGRAGRTQPLTASDSSSRGRSSTIMSPWRPARRTAATAPFLKSTRAPVRSWTTWANDGLWPTTSTFASASWRASSSSASSPSKPSPSTSSISGSTLSASAASLAVASARSLGLV